VFVNISKLPILHKCAMILLFQVRWGRRAEWRK